MSSWFKEFFQSSFAVVIVTGCLYVALGNWNSSPQASQPLSEDKPDLKNTTRTPKPKKNVLFKKPNRRKLANTSTSTQSAAPSQFKDKIERLKELDACEETENCDYPKTDPKSYYFAVGNDLKKELFRLNSQINRKGVKAKWVIDLAIQYLQHPNGHVKEAALHLLSSQQKSESALESILNNIIRYHDASLVEHAMLELERYLGGSQEPKIHSALSKAIATGSPMVSKEVVKHIDPFLNKESLPQYKDAAEKLSKSSMVFKQLQIAIEEYNKKQSAA